MHTIDRLTIKGYKSIRSLDDFELKRLNVLIGANGSGKSNFVGFFRFLRSLIEQRLQLTLAVEGGADVLLFMGPKLTREFVARIDFGGNHYFFSLVPTAENRLAFFREIAARGEGAGAAKSASFPGPTESHLKDSVGDAPESHPARLVYAAASNWIVYHFNDTSSLAQVRRQHSINDNEYLREDGANLAPFLYLMRTTHPYHYERIRDTVRMAAPFFDDFKLRPVPDIPDNIQLEWLQKDSDYPFRPSQMSDGTLRFVCLATALLQPSRPATMLFDEPELGLHPHAIALLGALFQKAASDGQVIVATQSPSLLNECEPEDVIVVDRANGESTFRRLNRADLGEWLEDYSLGDLWQKNILGGGPHEDRFFAPVSGASHKP